MIIGVVAGTASHFTRGGEIGIEKQLFPNLGNKA
jgi:hypothetical protein